MYFLNGNDCTAQEQKLKKLVMHPLEGARPRRCDPDSVLSACTLSALATQGIRILLPVLTMGFASAAPIAATS